MKIFVLFNFHVVLIIIVIKSEMMIMAEQVAVMR